MFHHKAIFSYTFFLISVVVLHHDSQPSNHKAPKKVKNLKKLKVMKKTALTFGLFSLAMVATSFVLPASTTLSNEKLSVVSPVDGSTGGGRKQDPRIANNKVVVKNNEGFANINQSFGDSKKID